MPSCTICVSCVIHSYLLLFYCYKSSSFPSIPNFNVEILLPSIFFWTLYCGSVNKFYFKLMIHLVEFQKIHCSAFLSCTNSTNILEKIILQTFKLKVLFRTVHIVKQWSGFNYINTIKTTFLFNFSFLTSFKLQVYK